MLTTNNGGVFWSIEFDIFSNEIGIEVHKTTPYTPQYNGVKNWMNMTFMEKSRTMLIRDGLEQLFLVEVDSTTFYLINESQTSNIFIRPL